MVFIWVLLLLMPLLLFLHFIRFALFISQIVLIFNPFYLLHTLESGKSMWVCIGFVVSLCLIVLQLELAFSELLGFDRISVKDWVIIVFVDN